MHEERMKCLLNGIAFLFLVSSSLLAAPACDRQCLAGYGTQYVDAMLAHKPERVPVAANLKYTEDGQQIKIGEGEWTTISGLTAHRRDILDVWHSFKITGGLIRAAEAFCKQMPPATKSGWE
jgi:hypothetical protein